MGADIDFNLRPISTCADFSKSASTYPIADGHPTWRCRRRARVLLVTPASLRSR